jgi:hypothetical protein
MLKTRKLTLKKEKVRILIDSNLERVQGGWLNLTNGCDTKVWCSTGTINKCNCPRSVNP